MRIPSPRLALLAVSAAVWVSASCSLLAPDDEEPRDPCAPPTACDPFPVASLSGRIHTVFDTLPAVQDAPAGLLQARSGQGHPDTAIAGFIEDGEAGRMAHGPATIDGYSIPALGLARRTVWVTIVDAEKSAIGRVLVQDSTMGDSVTVTEPVNGETSLETAVYLGAALGHDRIPEGRVNPPQVALVHRFSEDVAQDAATTMTEIEALVDAYRTAQDALVRGYAAMAGGYDSLTVNAAVRGPAQAYAEARDGGAGADEAHPDFIEGAVDAHVRTAETARQVAAAWGAFATLHDHELAERTMLTRLESARNLLHISVTARQELVAGVADGTAGKAEVTAALDDILAAGMAATDMQSFMDSVAAAVSDGADTLEEARGADLGAALAAADLSSFIDGSLTPKEIASELPDYISGVESSAGDADLAALLVALMGGPGYGGTSS